MVIQQEMLQSVQTLHDPLFILYFVHSTPFLAFAFDIFARVVHMYMFFGMH